LLSVSGVLLGYFYTGPPLRLKYRGLGDLAIIIGYGPLLTCGSFYCQSAALPPRNLLLFTLIPGLLTETILHVNNSRDRVWDSRCQAVTLPMILRTDRANQLYFTILFAIPYGICCVVALWPTLFLPAVVSSSKSWFPSVSLNSAAFLFPFVLLPQVRSLIRAYKRSDWTNLCQRCGQFALMFGFLHVIAILLWSTQSQDPHNYLRTATN